jgi:hypothetical protein
MGDDFADSLERAGFSVQTLVPSVLGEDGTLPFHFVRPSAH